MLAQTIIRKTLRVPCGTGPEGDGAGVARQMDAVLAGVGFKAARDLLEHVSGLAPGAAMDLALQVIGAVRGLVGDHVTHNAYFINFPDGVPDTVEFWVRSLRNALVASRAVGDRVFTDAELLAALDNGWVGLLELPTYGRYRHTYAELLAVHDELVESVKDRVTVLHLGGTVDDEARELYLALAGSPTPLGEADLVLLAQLAETCGEVLPERIPVRENRAVINTVRLAAGRPLVAVDTVVDVLRVACQASAGDVTLAAPTRFRSFARRERRVLLAALDQVDAGKLADVTRYAGPFKRLGERLHPHEYPLFPRAQDVFAVARGERTVRTLAGRAEVAFAAGDVGRAATVLAAAPGMLLRSLDRLLRNASTPAELDAVLDAMAGVLQSVSGRVLCSVREHLANRSVPDAARVFITRGRRAWVTPDARAPLPREVIERAGVLIDTELAGRLPVHERLVVDPAVLDVALPLSGKAAEDGFAVLPRGSRSRVDGEVLRFFTYWRQASRRTDFDLSALLLDEEFCYAGHVSWTRYHEGGAVYSGDITEASNGATEFIDIPLDSIEAAYVVPQVHVYSGEGFEQVAESMFGWMTRDRAQHGAPFDARTVRTRSDMRGTGRVAMPIMFGRDTDGTWTATWLHLYPSGSPRFDRVEANRVSAGLLARGLVNREYLTVRYLVDLLRAKEIINWEPGTRLAEPVTFLGLHRPEDLPEGSTVITLDRLNQLIPQ
ncbi:hypothetical protein [Actinophytocola sp.]|uniref:hypothetical protein n=1 Tax=Actinophytocola sp. TaxID=1872138 RepID=UPI002ED65042